MGRFFIEFGAEHLYVTYTCKFFSEVISEICKLSLDKNALK
jgi:hypothetical protein